MYRKHKLLTPAVADTDRFGTFTGTTFTQTQTMCSDEMCHIVTIKDLSGNSHAAQTFTLTGIDMYGRKKSEAITGPVGNATVSSANYYWKVTSLTVSATVGADTLEVGQAGVVIYSMPVPLPWSKSTIGVQANVTGTINYTLQSTLDDIQNTRDYATLTFVNHADTAWVGRTTTGQTNYAVAPVATRIVINTFTDGASILLDLTPRDDAR